MSYFSAALLVIAIALAVPHVLERRTDKPRVAAKSVLAIVAIAVGITSMVQVYRIGDAGAQSVWGGEIAKLQKASHG
jgi:hypothetical protein